MYLLFGEAIVLAVRPSPAVTRLFAQSDAIPFVILAFLAILIGSLYTTGLEELVDWLHRRLLKSNGGRFKRRFTKRLFANVAPLSPAALERLELEAARFFKEFTTTAEDLDGVQSDAGVTAFARKVTSNALWMEGKLAGTSLHTEFSKYRAEGELRLSSSLLIPIATFAVFNSLGFNLTVVIFATAIATALSLKLLDYGFYYYRRANSLIAHYIADGSVLSPEMEGLKRAKRSQRGSDQSELAFGGSSGEQDDAEESASILKEIDDILDRK